MSKPALQIQARKRLTFRENISIGIWAVKTTLKISFPLGLGVFITRIILDSEPLLNAYLFAKVIDLLIQFVSKPNTNLQVIVPYLALALIYSTIVNLFSQINNYCLSQLTEITGWKMPEFLYRKINELGIQSMEDPETVNLLQRARETSSRVVDYSSSVFTYISTCIKLVLSLLVVINISPVIALILSALIFPGLILDSYFIKKYWALFLGTTEDRRKVNSSSSMLQDSTSLHEIKITGAFDFLSNHYTSFVEAFMSALSNIRKKWRILDYLFDELSEVGLVIGYLYIFSNLINKLITIGETTFQIRALLSYRQALGGLGTMTAFLQESALRIKELKDIFFLIPPFEDGKIKIKKLQNPPIIKFTDVSFQYPNSTKYSLKNINLEIKPGEKIAIVGENGAGKTTLVKLICRLYLATEGKLTINEYDIKDLNTESWYKNIGVLFQDYNNYGHLTVKDNIFLGNSDEKMDYERILKAAHASDASKFIEDYKSKYDQILSEKFKGGTRPSTGQWQKLAIARFFYRNAPIVIFDEPTAAIDAISEARIFNQIYDFFTGKTVIIISHRFSTVRQADKIVVIHQGEIAETGSHEELLAHKGQYYKAFHTQAKGYK